MLSTSNYAFHRLCRTTQDYVFGFSGTNRARTPAFSLILAMAIVSRLKCEPGKDEQFFDLAHRIAIVNSLSVLNETLRIDIDETLQYIRKLYRFRQHQIDHKGWINPILSPESAISDFFGISLFFSKEDTALITENATRLPIDLDKLSTLFSDLDLFSNKEIANAA